MKRLIMNISFILLNSIIAEWLLMLYMLFWLYPANTKYLALLVQYFVSLQHGFTAMVQTNWKLLYLKRSVGWRYSMRLSSSWIWSIMVSGPIVHLCPWRCATCLLCLFLFTLDFNIIVLCRTGSFLQVLVVHFLHLLIPVSYTHLTLPTKRIV